MIVLFLKSQLGLFDKMVPIAGHVSQDGKLVAPHFGIRKVRLNAARPAQPHHTGDLFAHVNSTPAKPAPKPHHTGDLFSDVPARPAAAKERFTYGLRLRPAHISTLPKGYIAGSAHDDERYAHGTAQFDRRLTAEEVNHFDLVDIKGREEEYARQEKLLNRLSGNPALKERVDESGMDLKDIDDALLDEVQAEIDAEAKPKAKAKPVQAPTAPAAPTYLGAFDAASVPAFGVKAGTSKAERRRINAEAAEMVASKTAFTPADRDLLKQYSGYGGCGDSLNEFYTDPKVAAAMWHTLRRMGLPDDATALEPSCATGVFMETAPAGVKVTGVEMDQTSAKIGAVLHPGHEVQNASLERFATQDDRQFDLVIGNPPYGPRGSLLKDDKKDLGKAEAYFFDTALDKAKGGGLVALVVPSTILNNAGFRALRERLLRKGEFLGAVRMPNTAFEDSHTDVTADVVFFRKRDQEVAGALSAKMPGGKYAVPRSALKSLGVWDEEYLAGAYFEERGAGNVMGTVGTAMRSFGEIYAVNGSMVGVPEAIADFTAETPAAAPITVAKVLDRVSEDDAKERIRAGAARSPYDRAKRGDTKVVNGITYVLEGDPPRWHAVTDYMQTPAVTQGQEIGVLIEQAMQGADVPGLADRVRAYIEAHGIPSKNPGVMIAATQDKVLYRLVGAVKPDGTLSDVVEGRKREAIESSFDAAAQSLALELGTFTPEMVAARWGNGNVETATDHLYASSDYALDPEAGAWTSLDNYLSGELWPKLDAVRAKLAGGEDIPPEDRAKYERQAKALEETIDPKSLEDVEINMNSAFLPNSIVAAFFNDKAAEDGKTSEWIRKQAPLEITFSDGIYRLTGGGYSSKLLDTYLNRTGVRKDDMPQIDTWNKDFKAWLCASRFRDEVEDLYNRSFRGFRQRDYSNKAFDIPGLNTEGLKDYQYGGVRWALEAGKGIIAADVGLGKTVRGLILARMAKVTGKASKPIIVVPKSVLANWLAEAERWFPGSNVMTIGETYTRDKDGNLKGKQDTAAERNRKYHDLTQNDYDFILISQPAWNELYLDPETKMNYVNDDFWVQRGDALGNAGDKRLNKIRENYDQAVAKREFEKHTDAIYFNNLGVDMIIGDEFQAYKNLYAAKNRFGQAPKFLGGQGLSNRALDMNLKSRWVREKNGGKGVYGLSATPTKNSPLEIYSMLSHIAPEEFESRGIRNSEEFLDRYCEFREENVLTTGGAMERALVTVGFKNLDELRSIMRKYIDRKTAADVGLKLPERDDRQHMIDMSAAQKEVYAELRELADAAKGKDATGDAHIFSIMDKMGKAAMDLELLDATRYAGAKSPKYAVAAEQIAAGAQDGGQVVFADSIGAHDKMVDALVERGIPRNQIGIINAQTAKTSVARQNICDAFNSGKLKAVIGNTATMGEGMNLQKGTTDVHHLDLPWDPASMQQRNGRGLRQGNLSASVRLHTYLSKGSFDGYRYQSMMAKKDWQDLLWNGGDRVENLSRESVSRDDMLIMLSADPEAARAEVEKNKGLAKERFEAAQFTSAHDDFKRYKEMKNSYDGLRTKETPSAERLRVRLERTRLGLEQSPYFKAKEALTSDKPMLIQPTNGSVYEPGTAFEIDKADGAIHGGGRFIVDRVFPGNGSMSVRRYGEASGRNLSIDVSELPHGARPFDYDAGAEKAEISAALQAAAKDGMASVSSFKDLHALPSEAIQGAYASLQTQIKAGTKNYKFQHGHGDIGLIDPSGKAVAYGAYNASAKLDDHDMMLPTDAHREAAMQAYLEDERNKVFTTEAIKGRRGATTGHRSVVRWANEYGASGGQSNRWRHVGNNVFGAGFEKEAKARFETEQTAAMHRAKTVPDMIGVASKMAVGEYGTMAQWPKKALAMIWARAKRDDKLGVALNSELPTHESYGRVRASVPSDMLTGLGRHGSPENVGHMKLREALPRMAAARGHYDLAAAMVVSAASTPAEAVTALLGLHPNAEYGRAIEHLIAKHPELGERPASDFMDAYDARRLGDTKLERVASVLAGSGVKHAA